MSRIKLKKNQQKIIFLLYNRIYSYFCNKMYQAIPI